MGMLCCLYGQAPNWEVLNIPQYQYNMPIVANLEIDCQTSNDTNDLIALFDEAGVCRGVASIQNQANRYRAFITAYSNMNGETLSVRVYDADTDAIYMTNAQLEFSDGSLGEFLSVQHFTSTSGLDISVNAMSDQSVVGGTSLSVPSFAGGSDGTTYHWENSHSAIGLAASGIGDIPSFTAINNSEQAIEARITVTPKMGECTGEVKHFTITVRPSGDNAGMGCMLSNDTDDIIAIFDEAGNCRGRVNMLQFGNTYVAFVTAYSNTSREELNFRMYDASANTVLRSANTIEFADGSLLGSTSQPTIVSSSGTATGQPADWTFNAADFQYTMSIIASFTTGEVPTINPIADQVVESGGTLADIVFTGSPSNATFQWTSDNSELLTSGVGNIDAQTLFNFNTTNNIANITVTPFIGECAGAPETFTITVRPTGSFLLDCPDSEDENDILGLFDADGNCRGHANISNRGGNYIAFITAYSNDSNEELFFRTFDASENAIYNTGKSIRFVDGSRLGSPSAPERVRIADAATGSINDWTVTAANFQYNMSVIAAFSSSPNTQVDPVPDQVLRSGQTSTAITFSGGVAGTSYQWTSDNPNIGLPPSGIGNIPSFIAANSGIQDMQTEITVYPVLNGCAGEAETFTITVMNLQVGCADSEDTDDIVGVYDANGECRGQAHIRAYPAGNRAFITAYSNSIDEELFFRGFDASEGQRFETEVSFRFRDGTLLGTFDDPVHVLFDEQNGTATTAPSCTPNPNDFQYTMSIIASLNANIDLSMNPVEDYLFDSGDTSQPIRFSGAPDSTVYVWTNNNPAIGLPATGAGDITPFVTSFSEEEMQAELIVTPIAGECVGISDTFTIIIIPIAIAGDAPFFAENDTLGACQNTSILLDVLANDFIFLAPNVQLVNLLVLPTNGAANIVDQQIQYTPNTDYLGEDSFQYVIQSGATLDTAIVSLYVGLATSVNPTDDLFILPDELIAGFAFTGGTEGTIYEWTSSVNDGNLTDLPASGVDSIPSFEVYDRGLNSAFPEIIVTPILNGCRGIQDTFSIIAAVEAQIEASPDEATTCFNTSVTIDVLANDNIFEGEVFTITDISATLEGGTTELVGESIRYTPPSEIPEGGEAGFTDAFTYQMTDGDRICYGDVFVYVLPPPVLESVEDILVTAGETIEIEFLPSNFLLTYQWTNDNPNIGLAVSGEDNFITFSAQNPTNEILVANLSVQAIIGSCESPVETFTISIEPAMAMDRIIEISCTDGFFPDDGGADYPYTESLDEGTYRTLFKVCPDNRTTQLVEVRFNTFDVAPDDRLLAYDGEIFASNLIQSNTSGTGTGPSVSDAPGGGWVRASCQNPSGCINFVFEQRNDGTKGAGWTADVDCVSRALELECPENTRLVHVLGCADELASVEIPIPHYEMCGATAEFDIISSCAIAGLPRRVMGENGNTILGNFPIGIHTVRLEGRGFPENYCEFVVRVAAPNMACETDVTVSMDNDCEIILTPSLLMSNYCDNPAFSYQVSVLDAPSDVIIGFTTEGYPVIDVSYASCDTRFVTKISRTYHRDCEGNTLAAFTDECITSLNITDPIAPSISGSRVEEYDIYCYQNDNSLLTNLNGFASDTSAATIVLPNGDTLQLQSLNLAFYDKVWDNCVNWHYSLSDWEAVQVDCTQDQFEGFDPDGNGIADDVLWDLMAIETSDPAIFRKYYRKIHIIDACGNTSEVAVQVINVMQPDIVAPQPEIDLSCGQDDDPIAIYEAWLSGEYPEFATYIPNYDPTPLLVNLGDLDLAGLEDSYFTNVSGDEIPAVLNHNDCGYAIDWVDSDRIEACIGSYKIFRDWTIYNWCDGHLELIDIIPQVVKVGDFSAPVLVVPMTHETHYYEHDDCTVDLTFYYPDLYDECTDEDMRVHLRLNEGEMREFIGESIRFERMNLHERMIVYMEVSDICGNTLQVHDTLYVDDGVPPVAICEQIRVVSLDETCTVNIPASAFDDGSFDNCSSIVMQVARLDADSDEDGFPEEEDFGDFVTFTQADVLGCEDSRQQVVFRVQDLSGNVNYCNVEVDIQEQSVPLAYPLALTLDCQHELLPLLRGLAENGEEEAEMTLLAFSDLLAEGAFGTIAGVENACGTLRPEVVRVDWNDFTSACAAGMIRYEYQLVDRCNKRSLPNTGTIHITAKQAWTMTFPADEIITCTPGDEVSLAPAATLADILQNDGCDFWALNVKEETFYGQADACYKMIRTYHLVNWCVWNPTDTEVAVVERPDGAIWAGEEVQLHFKDEDHNNINDIDDEEDGDNYNITALENDADFVLLDFGDAPYEGITTYHAISAFSGVEETYVSAQAYGNIQYRQIVKVNDASKPYFNIIETQDVFCEVASQDDAGACSMEVNIVIELGDACSAVEDIELDYILRLYHGDPQEDTYGDLTYLGDGQYQIKGFYPLRAGSQTANHTFEFTLTDGCGNTGIQSIPFSVSDCTPPVAQCIFGISSQFVENDEVLLWASDFDKGSYDDCTPSSLLKLTFADPRIYPDSTNRVFSCANGELGMVTVELWAQDQAGNVSFCETFIVVGSDNPNLDCGDVPEAANIIISGLVETENAAAVELVEIQLSGAMDEQRMTDASGNYIFSELPAREDYSIVPRKDDDMMNGVTTFDLVLISRHILGIKALDSPYKMIAADVNNSGSITTFDLVLLRQLILRIKDNLANNSSWRFVPADFEFSNPAHPWDDSFPEVQSFNDMNRSITDATFIGIKVGDVNGTAQPNNLISTSESQTASDFTLAVKETNLSSGTIYNIPIRASNLEDIIAYQFTLQTDTKAIDIIDIESGIVPREHFGTFKSGKLTASWNIPDEREKGQLTSEDVLFTLVIQAKADALLSEVLHLTSSLTPAIAYTEIGKAKDIQMAFKNADQLQIQLYPNEPNPFEHSTTIGFYLPEAMAASLEIIDLSGKSIYQLTDYYASGNHKVTINLESLPNSGVLYYRLNTHSFTATKKMVKL